MLPPDAALCSINDHLVEPPDLWRGGRDAPFLQRVDGDERWVFGNESLPVRQLSVLAADGGGRATTMAGAHRAVFDPAARLAAMDDDGVELQTLLPHAIGFAGERLRHLPPGAWAAAVRRYNDYVLGEFCAAAPSRLRAAALVPFADQTASAAELQRAAALGAAGVTLPHAPWQLGLPGYADPSWSPLFAVSEETGLPLLLHVGSSGAPPSIMGAAVPGALLVQGGFDVVDPLTSLLFGYAFVRHPRLRVVLLEGGAGWLPFVGERIEFFVRQRPEVWSPPSRARRPSEIIAEQCYVSFIDEPSIGATLEAGVPADHVLWQCDFPHADSSWPDSRARVASQLATVDDRAAVAIAGGNARRLVSGV